MRPGWVEALQTKGIEQGERRVKQVRTWTSRKVMMWDEGHDVRWRPWCVKGFPDRKFCVKKGIGLLNPFIGSSAGRKFINFRGVAFYQRIWHLTSPFYWRPHFHRHFTSPFYWRPHFHPELNYNTIYLVRGGNGAANRTVMKHGVGF